MMLWVLFCIPMAAVTLGESSPPGAYDQAVYEAESSGRRTFQNSNPQESNSKFLDHESEEVAERPTPRRGIVDPEVADQLEGNGWLDVIPGTPGQDYPNYGKIPETSFTCDDKTPGGYYADIEARCQVFHVCDTGGQKSSFLCPSGSIFNQKYFVCDWWYDFECDDATDLYSLNEKVNRGGTGSGPGGPGRIEETEEYPPDEENFSREEFQNQANFVSADGFDLSLAGTGEGGPGYARNGDNKGYQSNVDDEDHGGNQNGGNRGQGTRRKSFNSQKTSGGLSKSENKRHEKDQAAGNERSNPAKGESGPPDVTGSREHFLKENSPAVGNPRVNYQPGYEGRDSNGPLKTNNFRTGNGRDDRSQQSNRFNENIHESGERPSANNRNQENSQRRETARKNPDGNENGQRSSTGQRRGEYLAPKNAENNYSRGSAAPGSSSGFDNEEFSNFESGKEEQRPSGGQGAHKNREFSPDRGPAPSSGSNGDEYRSSSGSRPGNIRGRQRTSGGLPGGLGNGYQSPGRARELPGSDAIADGITPEAGELYDEGVGDQRSSYSQHRTSSSAGPGNPGEVTSGQKIGFDDQSRHFRDDNHSPGSIRSSNGRKYSAENFQLRREKSFESNNQKIAGSPGTDRDDQSSGKNNGSDYLVGIVPGVEDRGNGSSDQPRRYLPIL